MTEARQRILVVDDEPAIRRLLRTVLRAHGYDTAEVGDGAGAVAAALAYRPHLVILDLGLPDMDGCDVTRRLREWSEAPVIILSVREQEADKISALDAGADDYLTKPFGVGELLARVRVALRRAARGTWEPLYVMGELRVDLDARRVTRLGREVQLTPTEYGLLRVLVMHAGKVRTHRQLLTEVWGAAWARETHLLCVNISNLRRKLEADPTRPYCILTEPGVGYRLRADL